MASGGNAFAFDLRDRNAQGAQLLEDVHEFAVALDLAVVQLEGMQEVVLVVALGIAGEEENTVWILIPATSALSTSSTPPGCLMYCRFGRTVSQSVTCTP